MDMKISQKHLCLRENTLGTNQSKYRSYNPLESIITYYVSLTKNLENGTLCRLFPTCRLLKNRKNGPSCRLFPTCLLFFSYPEVQRVVYSTRVV